MYPELYGVLQSFRRNFCDPYSAFCGFRKPWFNCVVRTHYIRTALRQLPSTAAMAASSVTVAGRRGSPTRGCGQSWRSGTRQPPCRGAVARTYPAAAPPRGSVEALSGQDNDQAQSSADHVTGGRTAADGSESRGRRGRQHIGLNDAQRQLPRQKHDTTYINNNNNNNKQTLQNAQITQNCH